MSIGHFVLTDSQVFALPTSDRLSSPPYRDPSGFSFDVPTLWNRSPASMCHASPRSRSRAVTSPRSSNQKLVTLSLLAHVVPPVDSLVRKLHKSSLHMQTAFGSHWTSPPFLPTLPISIQSSLGGAAQLWILHVNSPLHDQAVRTDQEALRRSCR